MLLRRIPMNLRFAVLALGLSSLCAAATESVFYLPIRNSDIATVRRLMREPGQKIRDSRGNSPLMYAAALGSMETLRLLVEAGADLNLANDFGATPLMWCAGDLPKVRYLVSKGANVNARSKL